MNYLYLNKLKSVILLLLFALLSSCGSGSGGVGSGLGEVPATVVVPPPPTLKMEVYLLKENNAVTENNVHKMVPGSLVKATVTLKDSKGLPVPNTLVTFKLTDDSGLVLMTPNSGKAITDSTGVAQVQIAAKAPSSGGVFDLSASATVEKTALVLENLWAIQVSPAKAVLGTPTLVVGTPNPLPANSIASIKIPVTTDDPIKKEKILSLPTGSINASSICSLREPFLASLEVLGVTDGIATVNYKNLGCTVNPDVVSISMADASSKTSISIPVERSSVSELQYVSATPSDKSLVVKGAGGVGRQESGTVTFKLINSIGNPVPDASVTFIPSTTAGGITVDPMVSLTNANGEVTTRVNAGYLPTPVSILATATDPKNGALRFTSASSLLSISAGPPEQKSFSLAVKAHNIRGYDIDGNTTDVTVRLADNWGNSIADSTVVNMIAESGKIAADDGSGSCIIQNSACTMTMTTQGTRPSDGKVSITAYATGIESYTDANNNGLFNSGELCGHLGSPFIDSNDNGVFDTGELLIPNITPSGTAVSNVYTPPKAYAPCAVRNPTYIHARDVIVFSGPPDKIESIGGAIPATFGRTCNPITINFTVKDSRSNPIAAGSIIAIEDAVNVTASTVSPSIVPSTTVPSVHSVSITPSDAVCKPEANKPAETGRFSITAKSGNDSAILRVSIAP
jgi:hypothetical protein